MERLSESRWVQLPSDSANQVFEVYSIPAEDFGKFVQAMNKTRHPKLGVYTVNAIEFSNIDASRPGNWIVIVKYA